MVTEVVKCPRCGVYVAAWAADTHCTDPHDPHWRGPFDGTYPVPVERRAGPVPERSLNQGDQG